jgi:hypothetical protein
LKKISVEVEEILNPKLSLTQKIVIEIQKSKEAMTVSEIYESLPTNSQRAIRAIVTELINKKILNDTKYCQCGRTRLLELN